MNPNESRNPNSAYNAVPMGILFALAAVVWAAALLFVNLRQPAPTHVHQQSAFAATVVPNGAPPGSITPESSAATLAGSDPRKNGVPLREASSVLSSPQVHETIHWNVTESSDGLLPLSAPSTHLPVTVQLNLCKEFGGKYQWHFTAINRSSNPWIGKIRIFLLSPEGTVQSEDFAIDTPLSPEDNIAQNYGRPLHVLETSSAPQISGGLITAYGYSLKSAK